MGADRRQGLFPCQRTANGKTPKQSQIGRITDPSRQGRAPLASPAAIALQSRQARSNALADLLDQVSHRRTA